MRALLITAAWSTVRRTDGSVFLATRSSLHVPARGSVGPAAGTGGLRPALQRAHGVAGRAPPPARLSVPRKTHFHAQKILESRQLRNTGGSWTATGKVHLGTTQTCSLQGLHAPPPRGEATWVSPRHNQPLAPQTTPAKEGSLENTAVSDFHYWWELVEAPSVSFAVEPPHRK